jgi:O6-methylguanine-DNA--protein-cysteine methyltransferase
MDVRESRLRSILGGDQRYLVPLYQRPYSWTEKQLERLWTDLLGIAADLQTNEAASHFTGSLVLDLGRAGPGTTEYLVVDGQQRLTTLSVLLCALRDHIEAHEPESPEKVAQIHKRYLIDEFKSGDDRLRLVPTQADLDDYRAMVDGGTQVNSSSRIATAYRFFRLQLELADDPDDPHDIDRIQDAVLGALAFVTITAKGEDNVYRIFESLNNTGMKLTQGDLLRNYLFMRLGARGDEVYQSWWLPMQERLSPKDLEGLFWMDLVVKKSELKQDDVYAAQQKRMDSLSAGQVFDEVKRFSQLSNLLVAIRQPEAADFLTADVRLHLKRIRDWGAVSADPLILHLLDLNSEGALSSEDLNSCLQTIESFLVRRIIVGAPATGLARILFRAASDMSSDKPVPESLMLYLSTGRKFFASDDQVREAARTKPLYYMGKASQKKLLLQWLDETFESKEPIDFAGTSIEHVLPQTMTTEWRDVLSAEAEADESAESIHEEIVNTLGNLTLTGYNSELSNRPYAEKREELKRSGIRLNTDIAANESWGRAQIRKRSDELADLIVKTWVAPVQVSEIDDSGATWTLVREAVEAIPAGYWTGYGDLAVLASTYPQPVAGFVSRNPIPGAWRVLKRHGNISPGFNWGPHTQFAGRDPIEVLESEGLAFHGDGLADPEKRLRAADLARLLGIQIENPDEIDAEIETDFGFDSFAEQLQGQPASTAHGVLELLSAWQKMGGSLEFGRHSETSCFLVAHPGGDQPGLPDIWPFTIYPRVGTVEVVFEYLKNRPPFDQLSLRQELRERLIVISGIEIAETRLGVRPSFSLEVLADASRRAQVLSVLEWFLSQVTVAAD